jgi:WD40 repeat protein
MGRRPRHRPGHAIPRPPGPCCTSSMGRRRSSPWRRPAEPNAAEFWAWPISQTPPPCAGVRRPQDGKDSNRRTESLCLAYFGTRVLRVSAKITRRTAFLGIAAYIASRVARSGPELRPSPPAILQTSGDFVWTLAVSQSGRFAASGHVAFSRWRGGRGGVTIWDLRNRRAVGRYEHGSAISTIAFSPDETLLLVGARSNRAKILRRDGGAVLRELQLGDGCWSFAGAFSGSGDHVVLCESTLEVPGRDARPSTKVWDVKTGKALRAFPRPAKGFTSDASLAIEWNGTLWNLVSGRDESPRPPRDADWSARALSCDGRLALLSSLSANAGPVGLWEPGGGSQVRRLEGHTAQVWAGAFTGDGKRLATAAGEKRNGWQDCSVRIWHTSSRRELATLRGHESGVRAVAVSPDGRQVVSGDVNGRVVLWELSG